MVDAVVHLSCAVTNEPLEAVNDLYTTPFNTPVVVSSPSILVNNPNVWVVNVTQPSHGTVVVIGNGSFLYTPSLGFVGVDSYTYQVFDGANYSNVATVYIIVALGAQRYQGFQW